MPEEASEQEINNTPEGESLVGQFEGHYTSVNETEAPGCGDGRPNASGAETVYPQVLGGSIFFALIRAIKDEMAEPESVTNSINHYAKDTFGALTEHGYGIGVHRDDHSTHSNAKSGCGAADRAKDILTEISSLDDSIIDAVEQIAPGLLPEESELEKFKQAAGRLANRDGFVPSGEEIITVAENSGAKTMVLKGDHEERGAILNLREGQSLNVAEANAEGHQVFNVDAWYASKVAEKIGIELRGYETVLHYVATGRVLTGTTPTIGIRA